jgi:hypothetical protein
METPRTLFADVLAPKSSVLGDPFTPLAPLGGTVLVTSGVNNEWLPLAGRTVGEIRRRLVGRLDFDVNAVATLGGRSVGDDVIVRPGEHLAFIRESGSKGGRP